MGRSLSSFWWESITGPATVVDRVVSMLGDARNVALRLPPRVPWEEQFRSAVTEELRRRQATRGLVIERIAGGSAAAPEDIMLSFALEGEALSWRPHRESLSDFLTRTRALRGRLVWVSGLDEEGARRWSEACKGMSQDSAADGLVLLECPDVRVKGMAEVRYSSLVSEYASRLLCASLADRSLPQHASDARKGYTAALLSRLCEGDVELAVELSSHYVPGRDDPLGIVGRVCAAPDGLERRAETHVWEAQLECIFPIVESGRLGIVDRHAEQLDRLCEEGLYNSFGDPVETRFDIEIGTLFWLTVGSCPRHMKLRDCERDEIDRIRLLRDCRNALAHRRTIGEEAVRRLLD